MDPALSQALASLIGALTTAILLAASYYWGPRQRGNREDRRRSPETDEQWTYDSRVSDEEE